VAYRLKQVGTSQRPYEDSRALEKVWFPANKYPRQIAAGDLLVIYAVGWKRFPAIVKVLTPAGKLSDDSNRHPEWGAIYPWGMKVKPVLRLSVDDAPTASDCGFNVGRIQNGNTYLKLDAEEFGVIRQALLDRQAELLYERSSAAALR